MEISICLVIPMATLESRCSSPGRVYLLTGAFLDCRHHPSGHIKQTHHASFVADCGVQTSTSRGYIGGASSLIADSFDRRPRQTPTLCMLLKANAGVPLFGS